MSSPEPNHINDECAFGSGRSDVEFMDHLKNPNFLVLPSRSKYRGIEKNVKSKNHSSNRC